MQGGMDATDDMVDVLDAAAEVGVVHALEHGGQPVALDPQRVVGAVALPGDQAIETLKQFGIVEQQRVEVEELADLAGQGAVQARAHLAQLRAHHADRLVQARDLGRHGGSRDALLRDFQRVRLAHACPAQGVAPRSALAGEQLAHQLSSSKRRSNSAHTASAAAASSAPSTRSVTAVPVPAASSITPMMLLALT